MRRLLRLANALRVLADLIEGVALWNETIDALEDEEMRTEGYQR